MGTRNDDISLKLAKAVKAGFLPDVSDSEVDILEKEARSILGNDGALALSARFPVLHGTRYKAYGHSFGVYDSGTNMNLWQGSLYPARIRDLIHADTALYLNNCVGNDQMKDTAQRALGDATRFWNAGDYGLITLLGNQNDFGRNRTAQGITSYKNSLRSFLSTVRAKSRIEASAAVQANASDFTTIANNGCSNGQFVYSGTTGATFTFSGNTFTDATVMLVGFTDAGGANYEVRVDGVLKATGSTALQHTVTGNAYAQYGPVAVQLRGLSNTSHTVEVKHVGGGSSLAVDCFLPWSDSPPTTVLIKDVTDTAAGYARYGSPPTDADVIAFNSYMLEIASEFTDDSVIIADPFSEWKPALMTGADGQHPNDRGSAALTKSVLDALSVVSYRKGLNLGIQ